MSCTIQTCDHIILVSYNPLTHVLYLYFNYLLLSNENYVTVINQFVCNDRSTNKSLTDIYHIVEQQPQAVKTTSSSSLQSFECCWFFLNKTNKILHYYNYESSCVGQVEICVSFNNILFSVQDLFMRWYFTIYRTTSDLIYTIHAKWLFLIIPPLPSRGIMFYSLWSKNGPVVNRNIIPANIFTPDDKLN